MSSDVVHESPSEWGVLKISAEDTILCVKAGKGIPHSHPVDKGVAI